MIEAYSNEFFGYGQWDAPVWFIGLEEAGAGTPTELQARLAAWNQRGRRELEAAPSFYPACGQHHWHGPDAALQRTWRQLIRMLLVARGEPGNEEDLLGYQKNTLGTFSGDVCLTELLPLPAPSHRHWPYAAHENLPFWMRSREQFTKRVIAGRIATLQRKIAVHRPRTVIFYFWKPRPPAEAIAGGEFQTVISEKLLGFESNDTACFITGHPASGYPDSYFEDLGIYFRSKSAFGFADKCGGIPGQWEERQTLVKKHL
jgi:hypothetical protein